MSQQSVASANELLLCFLSCHVVMSSHVIIEKREIVTQGMRSDLSNNDGRNFSRKKIVMYSKLQKLFLSVTAPLRNHYDLPAQRKIAT